MPYMTPTDVSIQATKEIIRLLKQPDAIQISKVGNKKIDAIKQLADIFKKPQPEKVSTPVSDPRVTDNVTATPSLRVLVQQHIGPMPSLIQYQAPPWNTDT